MRLDEFGIGREFAWSGWRMRCTDLGTRVVAAIRVDRLVTGDEAGRMRDLTGSEAEAEGWFRGPPYPVLEYLLDEDEQAICEPAP